MHHTPGRADRVNSEIDVSQKPKAGKTLREEENVLTTCVTQGLGIERFEAGRTREDAK